MYTLKMVDNEEQVEPPKKSEESPEEEPVITRRLGEEEEDEDEFIRGDLQRSIEEGADDEGEIESEAEVVEPAIAGDKPVSPRKPASQLQAESAQDLLLRVLPIRASQASPLLKREILGSVMVSLRSSGEKFLFDWSKEAALVEKTSNDKAECVISISEENLLQISKGKLNPQIGMLSDKIKASGNLSLAVYFFNLIAPQQRA